jgi:hypothetical protein
VRNDIVLGAALPIGVVILNLAARWWLRQSGRRELSILQITRHEAHPLKFPAGHPLTDMVYAGNPAVPNVYYPLAEFHRQTFNHKIGEALTLLASLGANAMTVAAVQGWGREFAANLDFAIDRRTGGEGLARTGTTSNPSFVYAAELKRHESTVWTITATFPPNQSKALRAIKHPFG